MREPGHPLLIDRRSFVLGTAGLVATLGAGCSRERAAAPRVGASDAAVAAREAARRSPGARVVDHRLAAMLEDVDLAGRTVSTWTYGRGLGGDGIRVKAGDVLRVELSNRLPQATTIHWHGIALRNDMDGVDHLTQPEVASDGVFVYEFAVPDPGTYFFHPHVGLQADRGLYLPLVVEDPADAGAYDAEALVVLDDWTDGVGGTPESQLAAVSAAAAGGGAHGAHGAGGGPERPLLQSSVLRGHAGDVDHPLHLLNGRPAADRPTITAAAGGRLRLRIINAAADTAYRLAVGGHRLTVTHADGFPVVPVEADAILLGMGERYDVVVQLQSGAWPLVASAEGKGKSAVGVVRTADASQAAAPPADAVPSELSGKLVAYRDLRAADAVSLPATEADRTHDVKLGESSGLYTWTINGRTFDEHRPLEASDGERVRLRIKNDTSMWHPMHLHGHTFAMTGAHGTARKDTVNVLPDETVVVEFDADNPGQWMLHCHNAYHLEAGMATVLSYVK